MTLAGLSGLSTSNCRSAYFCSLYHQESTQLPQPRVQLPRLHSIQDTNPRILGFRQTYRVALHHTYLAAAFAKFLCRRHEFNPSSEVVLTSSTLITTPDDTLKRICWIGAQTVWSSWIIPVPVPCP